MAIKSLAQFADEHWYTLPDGTSVYVVHNTDDRGTCLGSVLYTEQEWETASTADYECDAAGRITFQEEFTGWAFTDLWEGK
mgnify:CR=1 FL=1